MEYLKSVGRIFLIALALLLGVFGLAWYPLAANIHFGDIRLLWVTIPWALSWYGAIYIWYNGIELIKRKPKIGTYTTTETKE